MIYRKIVEMNFGSVLYGTNTPSSDTDIKGVFVPSISSLFLQTTPSVISLNTKENSSMKNTKDDVDHNLYSLNKFMSLLLEGQVVALDMLFTPKNMILEDSWIWNSIVSDRERFLSKNTQAFVGYCRTQAAKYGVKGSRISAITKVIATITENISNLEELKLKDCFDLLPTNDEYISTYTCPISKQRTYEVCNRKFQESVSMTYMKGCLLKILDAYGERAKLAEKNENIDWKAISHAFRVCYEVKELLLTHKITFPLVQADFLKEVKSGKMHYVRDNIADRLSELMDEVNRAALVSTLPDAPDKNYANDFIIDIYRKCFIVDGGNERYGGM